MGRLDCDGLIDDCRLLLLTSAICLVGCSAGLIDDGVDRDEEVVAAEVPPRSCATAQPTETLTLPSAMADRALVGPRGGRGDRPDPADLITIPVYVHVVSALGGEGEVSDAAIAAQVQVLDAAFVATRFRFALAGVNRAVRNSWFEMTPGSLAESSVKSALHRGTAADLNLYTAGPADGQLGWSSFPSDYEVDPIDDGVVVFHGSLPGGNATPFDEGDTATHEVGHWLGLYHTFQGGCDKANDFVPDTAAEAAPAFGCPFGRDSCTGTLFPGRDPVENFMGLSDDACMVEFTPGQAARMEEHWLAYRAGR